MQAYQRFEFVSCEQIFVYLNFKLYITVGDLKNANVPYTDSGTLSSIQI